MHASRTFGRASDASGGRVRARIGFDERLARRIYAGADLLLVPSRYEPCGMTQMIAMRYGAIPIARETGGLADAVRDLDLAGSLAWRSRPAQWAALIATAMAEDSSWERSAAVYAELYEAIARERRTVAEAASPVTEVDQASETASETASGGGA